MAPMMAFRLIGFKINRILIRNFHICRMEKWTYWTRGYLYAVIKIYFWCSLIILRILITYYFYILFDKNEIRIKNLPTVTFSKLNSEISACSRCKFVTIYIFSFTFIPNSKSNFLLNEMSRIKTKEVKEKGFFEKLEIIFIKFLLYLYFLRN